MDWLKFETFAPNGKAFHVARVELRRRRQAKIHTHADFAEIFWVEEGEGLHEVNGVRERVYPGDMVLMRAKDRHGIRSAHSGGCVIVNIAFSSRTLALWKQRYFPRESGYWNSGEPMPRRLRVSRVLVQRLKGVVDALATAPRTPLELDRFLLNLFHDLNAVGHQSKEPDARPDWLRRACAQIQTPAHFIKGTQELAQLAGRSPEHVARVLKQTTGFTPSDVVNRARMEYAAAQLAVSSEDILAIAMDCGFNSLGHFYQLFKKCYGESPRKYRIKLQRTVAD